MCPVSEYADREFFAEAVPLVANGFPPSYAPDPSRQSVSVVPIELDAASKIASGVAESRRALELYGDLSTDLSFPLKPNDRISLVGWGNFDIRSLSRLGEDMFKALGEDVESDVRLDFNHEAAWRKKIGESDFGDPSYASPVALRCRRERKERVVSGSGGDETRIVDEYLFAPTSEVSVGDLLDGERVQGREEVLDGRGAPAAWRCFTEPR